MKVAHLILTHKNPAQVQVLLNMLAHPQFDCFLHVDQKTDIRAFLHLSEKPSVHFIKNRARVYWGDYGTIAATINGYREILGKGYDYINVVSGQDLLIKPAEELFQFLCDKKGMEFMTCEPVFGEWNVGPRVTEYHLANYRFPGKYRVQALLNKILPKRRFPLDYELVGRANWFTITSAAAQYLLDFIDKNPAVVRYFKYCWGPDEIMFPTILYNSHFKNALTDNLVYVDWSEGNAHPKLLGMDDLPTLTASGKFFARKFDLEKDPRVITHLQELYGRKIKPLS